ncbi:uncharacterized protein MONOS_5627 [Monocercomonoides exilis]|uniref:uncharacterized protein n=1 Tax=Monocercomonoides exilis TaxID=2049356 RepID=UPI003559C63E|nr:hypothetical protein MONOS_5627 [Monocercomonoides exilis]|eukprot:MONOS_5627.1-p1 / transcript=MONOS_5627.1 / gene=MONOS_5627 / organism=Monocercomonoides_exilis_PA203 / gene_product=unspecified product / transcript_product=unspecified product / location=Mono_scaffold00166:35352-36452(+) / protein_length=259 / sequence_SO=supercontig / SO=protein_coding / is_pseudo=false
MHIAQIERELAQTEKDFRFGRMTAFGTNQKDILVELDKLREQQLDLSLHLISREKTFQPALAQEGMKLDSKTPGQFMSDKVSHLLTAGMTLHESPHFAGLGKELSEGEESQAEVRDMLIQLTSSLAATNSRVTTMIDTSSLMHFPTRDGDEEEMEEEMEEDDDYDEDFDEWEARIQQQRENAEIPLKGEDGFEILNDMDIERFGGEEKVKVEENEETRKKKVHRKQSGGASVFADVFGDGDGNEGRGRERKKKGKKRS